MGIACRGTIATRDFISIRSIFFRESISKAFVSEMHAMNGFVPAPTFFSGNTSKASICNSKISFSSKFRQSFGHSLNSQRKSFISLKRTRKNLICMSSSGFPEIGNRPCKIGILVSGGGRSLQNLCERIHDSKLENCEISVVVASRKTAKAIQKAENFGVPTRVLRAKDFDQDTKLFSEAITDVMDEFEVDLIVMAGWMHFFLIPQRYYNRVINIHPSLIPSFCGKGYYGDHVHEAVVSRRLRNCSNASKLSLYV